ncbi:hypothetical protein AWB79_06911 [Caballeronia hypogeia]|uniref:T6SS Phospholipase effector Tle1-like catalytic domain-containing protein n=1 Tax=Caballeronia hypogeia TaxID=1777140 RepID=A0A158DFL4_9BURK|nr:DUF2235 domain-containing protein [Caballeronia hypogeia]SAK93200.1 hypothetical protein AWB79_06911 [Caballeronia hypogeia]
MAKNIVFCADGTWNGPHSGDDDGVPKTTNVWKLFTLLAGTSDTEPDYQSEQELVDSASGQVAKYLHGVGDSNNPLTKLLGGALGAGLVMRIVRGYTYISRNYTDNDLIYLIGFSRGAYTARALAGLIADMGLLKPSLTTDPIIAYRMGMQAWRQHQAKKYSTTDAGQSNPIDSILDHLPHLMFSNLDDDDLVQVPDGGIKAVAVWDTVGSLGIPNYLVKQDSRYDAFQFADTKLNPKIGFGFHAISLDEQRADFTPTFWDPRDDNTVTQVLFAGAHSDVGGGYALAESGLSDIACKWMIQQLQGAGVNFRPDAIQTLNPNSRSSAHQPWLTPPFDALPRGPRQDIAFPKAVGAHRSIFERLAKGSPGVRADPSLAPGVYMPACFATDFAAFEKWAD